MNEYRILIITDLGTLRADHPILNAITMSEVITLPITQSFLKVSRGLSSKGVPGLYKVCRTNKTIVL